MSDATDGVDATTEFDDGPTQLSGFLASAFGMLVTAASGPYDGVALALCVAGTALVLVGVVRGSHFPQDVDASNLTNEDFFDQFAFNSQTETEGTTINEEGFVYEYTAEETGVSPYVCTPHRTLQMKGVLVVGEDNAETELSPFGSGGGDGGTALSTVVGGAAVFGGVTLAGVAAYRELVGADTE
jgi:hypothetical protein